MHHAFRRIDAERKCIHVGDGTNQGHHLQHTTR